MEVGAGALAALPGVLLGMSIALLALADAVITSRVLPLTEPVTRVAPESIQALARKVVRSFSQMPPLRSVLSCIARPGWHAR